MHLRDGRCGDTQVLSPESLAYMHRDRVAEVYEGDAVDVLTGVAQGYGMGWWVDRDTGRITSLGAFGAMPWLDLDDGYGAYLVLEATSGQGRELAERLYDVIEEAVLGARG